MSPKFTPRPPLPALTGLRFVAAAAVVLMHYRELLPYPPLIYHLLGKGMTGVGLFFILSGFILTYTYAGRGMPARAFWLARFARVAPLYFLALAGGVGVTAAVGSRLAPAELAASFALNLTALQAWVPWDAGYLWNPPAWSISAEAVFYLIFPAILPAIFGRRRAVLWAILAGLFAAEVVTYAGFSRLPGWATNLAYYSPASRVWEFLIGCTLAALWVGGLRLSVPLRRATLALAGFWVVALALAYTGPGDQSVAFTPAYAVVILALASGPSLLSRALSIRPLVLLGEASYALYILHWLPLRLVGDSPWPVALAALAGTLAASVAAYRWVETPARRWLRSEPVRRWPHDQVFVQRPRLVEQGRD